MRVVQGEKSSSLGNLELKISNSLLVSSKQYSFRTGTIFSLLAYLISSSVRSDYIFSLPDFSEYSVDTESMLFLLIDFLESSSKGSDTT